MRTPTERFAARFHENAGFLATNLVSEDSGVEGTVIWFFAGDFSSAESRDGPRIVVVLGDHLTVDSLANGVPVMLSSPPVVLGTLPVQVAMDVTGFIENNRETLLRHWVGKSDTCETLALLAPHDAGAHRGAPKRGGE